LKEAAALSLVFAEWERKKMKSKKPPFRIVRDGPQQAV